MTEEDQKLVTLAALHGARFRRIHDEMWGVESIPAVAKWTIGRAAEFYLAGLRSGEEHKDYDLRTDVYSSGQEIAPEFLASVLA